MLKLSITTESCSVCEEDLLVSDDEIEVVEPHLYPQELQEAVHGALEAYKMLNGTSLILRAHQAPFKKGAFLLLQKVFDKANSLAGIASFELYQEKSSLGKHSTREKNLQLTLEAYDESATKILHSVAKSITVLSDQVSDYCRVSTQELGKLKTRVALLTSSIQSNFDSLSTMPEGKYQNTVAISKLKMGKSGYTAVGFTNLLEFLQYNTVSFEQGVLPILKEDIQTICEMAKTLTDKNINTHLTSEVYSIYKCIEANGQAPSKHMCLVQMDLLLPGCFKPTAVVIDNLVQNNLLQRDALNLHAQQTFFFKTDANCSWSPQEIEYLDKETLLSMLKTMSSIIEQITVCCDKVLRECLEAKEQIAHCLFNYASTRACSKNSEDISDGLDSQGFTKDSDEKFVLSLYSLNSFIDHFVLKMNTKTVAFTKDALLYGLQYAVSNYEALSQKKPLQQKA